MKAFSTGKMDDDRESVCLHVSMSEHTYLSTIAHIHVGFDGFGAAGVEGGEGGVAKWWGHQILRHDSILRLHFGKSKRHQPVTDWRTLPCPKSWARVGKWGGGGGGLAHSWHEGSARAHAPERTPSTWLCPISGYFCRELTDQNAQRGHLISIW